VTNISATDCSSIITESALQDFAAAFANSVANQLRARVDARPLPLFALPYHEYRLTLANPTCLAVLNVQPWNAQMCLEITPPLAFLLLERMLGGADAPVAVPRRPFTALESRLLLRVLDSAINQLGLSLNVDVQRAQRNPRDCHIAPPNEPITVAGFDIHIGRQSGRLSLCIPSGFAPPASGDSPAAMVTLTAVLTESSITRRDLAALAVGDVITTELTADSPVMLISPTGTQLPGTLVQLRGHRAVQIAQIPSR